MMISQLSATQIRYLFAIRELENQGVVRQGHIAQKLGVSDQARIRCSFSWNGLG